MNNMDKRNHRIGYIDAMRGLAMYLVVIGHVYVKSFNCESIYYNMLCWQIEIPLFFFVSGFLASTMLDKPIRQLFADKSLRLVLPALLFLGIYDAVFDLNYCDSLFRNMKDGYWFTLSLFEYIIIFVISDKILRLLKISSGVSLLTHALLALFICYIGAYFRVHHTNQIVNLLILPELINYPFYIMGYVIFHKRNEIIQDMKSNSFLGLILISLYIVGEIILVKFTFDSLGLLSTLCYTALITSAVFIIWYCFDNCGKQFFDQKSVKFISLIGRRSLDVYFIHYFLLPINLKFIGSFFKTINASFIEFIIAVVIAFFLVITSLLIGSAIRKFPSVSQLLLGTKHLREVI